MRDPDMMMNVGKILQEFCIIVMLRHHLCMRSFQVITDKSK